MKDGRQSQYGGPFLASVPFGAPGLTYRESMSEIDWNRRAAEAFGAAAALDAYRGCQESAPLESEEDDTLSGLDRVKAKRAELSDLWESRAAWVGDGNGPRPRQYAAAQSSAARSMRSSVARSDQ
jgi:hypothetical protein